MAACRRRRADLPDRLHGVGEDDGRAPAGRAPGLGVRRPGRGHRGRRPGQTVAGDLRGGGGGRVPEARDRGAARGGRRRRKSVVATGGGAPCREENLEAMLEEGRVFWLGVSAEEAVRRAGKRLGPAAARRRGRSGRRRRAAARGAAAVLRARPRARGDRRPDAERDRERAAPGLDGWMERVGTNERDDVKRMSDTPFTSSWARAATTSASATFTPDAIADMMAAALDPDTTGVAVLVDANVAEQSARARELVAALGGAAAARRRAWTCAPGEACKNLTEIEKIVRVAGRPRLRPARRGRRHRRRRRHGPRRLRRRDLPARRAVRAGADDVAGDGRRLGGRQDRRRSRRRARTWSARSTSRARSSPTSASWRRCRRASGSPGWPRWSSAASSPTRACWTCSNRAAPELTVAAAIDEIIARAVRVKADVVVVGRARVGPARDPELRPHRRARAGGGVGLRPAARRGGGAGDGRGAGSRRGAGRRRARAGRPRARVCSRGSACRSTTNGDSTRRRRRGSPSTRSGAGRPSASSSCPAPGETRLVEISPADIASHLSGRSRCRKLDAPGPLNEYKRQSRCPVPFDENITQLVEKLDGGVAAVLMGFDGISVDSFAKAATTARCPTSRRWRWSSPT